MLALQSLGFLAALVSATPAAWDPAAKGGGTTLSNSDRTAASSTANQTDRATGGKGSGKWYAEITLDTGAAIIGVGTASASASGYPGSDAHAWAYHPNGNLYNAGSGAALGATFTTGDVIMIALDMDAGKVWLGKNGTWQGGGDPAAGTSPAVSGLSGTLHVVGGRDTSSARQVTGNWGQAAFAHTPPSGFSAWSL